MTDNDKQETPDQEHIPLDPSPRESQPVIDKPSFTEDMSEDEIESIERDEIPPNPKQVESPTEEIPPNALGAHGRFGWRAPTITGAIAMVAAVILAGVYAPESTTWWKASLRQLIDAPLYAWIGVGAVLVTGRMIERPFGAIQFVVARMTLAVGSFVLLWQLAGVLVSEQYIHNMLRWPLAAISGAFIYAGWCLYSFRLDRQGVGILAGFHVIAWFVLWLFRAVGS